MSVRARLLRVAVGVVIVVVVAEAGALVAEGLTGTRYEVYSWRPYEPHPTLGWSPVPDGEQVVRIDGRVIRDRSNSLGMLAPEMSASKAPGTLRLLVIGDSITEGLEVAREDRFVSRLDESLRGHGGEALPAGRSGYQTDQEVLFYELEGRPLAADVVLLVVFVGNDVMGNVDAVSPGPFGPVAKPRFRFSGGELVLQPPAAVTGIGRTAVTVFDSVKVWLAERSALYRAARAAWGRTVHALLFREMPSAWQVFSKEAQPATAEAWSLTDALLARLASDVERDGARLAVAIVPDQIQVRQTKWQAVVAQYGLDPARWDPDGPSARFAAICAVRELTCLDLLPALRAATDEPYLPSGGHLAPSGHRIVADALLEWLSRERLIP